MRSTMTSSLTPRRGQALTSVRGVGRAAAEPGGRAQGRASFVERPPAGRGAVPAIVVGAPQGGGALLSLPPVFPPRVANHPPADGSGGSADDRTADGVAVRLMTDDSPQPRPGPAADEGAGACIGLATH